MIKKITLQEVEKIAELHQENIREAFFSKLGKDFLLYLYNNYFRSDDFLGYCYVDDNNDVLGFVTCSIKKDFFSKFIRNNFSKLLTKITFSIIKHPKSIISFFQTISCLLFDNVKEESEIFSIAVKEGHRDKKIGKLLIEELFKDLRVKNIQSLKVLVDSSIPANGFYQKMKFRLTKTIGFLGRRINIYILYL